MPDYWGRTSHGTLLDEPLHPLVMLFALYRYLPCQRQWATREHFQTLVLLRQFCAWHVISILKSFPSWYQIYKRLQCGSANHSQFQYRLNFLVEHIQSRLARNVVVLSHFVLRAELPWFALAGSEIAVALVSELAVVSAAALPPMV